MTSVLPRHNQAQARKPPRSAGRVGNLGFSTQARIAGDPQALLTPLPGLDPPLVIPHFIPSSRQGKTCCVRQWLFIGGAVIVIDILNFLAYLCLEVDFFYALAPLFDTRECGVFSFSQGGATQKRFAIQQALALV